MTGPAGVRPLLAELSRNPAETALTPDEFLDDEAYAPLPTLVQAARDLFQHGDLPYIKRARAATNPAVLRIVEIAREAAKTRTRRLVLLSGVPGSGKTLVGLRLVQGRFLDELAIPRAGDRSGTPAIFLSGNGPLVEVLQHALRDAGGGGKVFVRGIKDFIRHFRKPSRRRANAPGNSERTPERIPERIPEHHLLVFDEAQRAFDAGMMQKKHANNGGVSEPEVFLSIADRIPEWCVVVGLIGSGQEIHAGEEGGIIQWRKAIAGSVDPSRWTVHAPAQLAISNARGRTSASICGQSHGTIRAARLGERQLLAPSTSPGVSLHRVSRRLGTHAGVNLMRPFGRRSRSCVAKRNAFHSTDAWERHSSLRCSSPCVFHTPSPPS